VINLFAVAIRLGIPAADLKDVIFAYPTNGSDLPSML
jgi:glutathione reductase (NADPH)